MMLQCADEDGGNDHCAYRLVGDHGEFTLHLIFIVIVARTTTHFL